ncbi:MAG TPA: tetratricopeptide repeat protein [Gemmatales bacterium]|nr:tetratricopeptide repeat protein [Gemmatales bacterium]
MRLVPVFLLSMAIATVSGCSREKPGSKVDKVVIFRAEDGRTVTMADLRGQTGAFQYEKLGKKDIPAEAESLHKQARDASESGDYPKAITLLEKATGLAPAWPHPVYDLAVNYLQMNDTEKARKYFRKTIELAPRGFFTAITALDALDREATGDLPVGTYQSYVSLDQVKDPDRKKAAISQVFSRVPGFAPAWKEWAMQLDTDNNKLDAIEKGLAAKPDVETRGLLLIIKARILNRNGDYDGAAQLLGTLILDTASTYATEHLAKVTLAPMAQEYLAHLYSTQALSLLMEGKHEQVDADMADAIVYFTQGEPLWVSCRLLQVAWVASVHPDKKVRNAEIARLFITKAEEYEAKLTAEQKQTPIITLWNRIAIVKAAWAAETGDFKKAVEIESSINYGSIQWAEPDSAHMWRLSQYRTSNPLRSTDQWYLRTP